MIVIINNWKLKNVIDIFLQISLFLLFLRNILVKHSGERWVEEWHYVIIKNGTNRAKILKLSETFSKKI